MGEDREEREGNAVNDSTKFETLLRSDRESERKVSRRMLVTWFAAVAVMALWLAVYRFYS